MDTTKIIKGAVSNGRYTVTAPIVKEDYGLYLQIEGVELPSTYEVDFSNSENSGTSVTMIGNADGVLIPHQFIDTGKDIFAFLYHVGADFGRTVYKFRIPNKVRPDRTDETPTPEEQSTIDQLIGAMNTAVAQTAQDKADADASAQNASADADRAEEARTDAQNYATQAEQSATDAQESASQASASATASANSASASAQIKADVEDMVDDAQASASASAQSATASANSASQAQGYAQSASASAQSASGYASNAQSSAQTASSKASEASTSASTASAKATEASQSATTASNKASEASGYATSASQAKTDAESARDLAQGYASDAQVYAENAQASAESISASASQIAQNTADIASLEEDRYKPYVTDSASGRIASFTDGADDLPLKSLVVNIDPVQDLHGYDSPWVAGGGKNVFDQTLMRDREVWYNIAVKVKPSTKYIMSTSLTTTTSGLYCYFNNTNAQGGSSTALVYQGHSVAVTSTEDGYVYVSQRRSSGEDSFQNYQWQIEEGTTRTDYAPYENICPISGWTGANVWADGKNLLDPTLLKDQEAWNIIRVYAPVGTRLTMSTNNSNVTTATGLLCFFKRHSESQGSSNIVSASHPVTRTVYDDGYVEVVQRNPSGTLSFDDFQWQIEIGSTPTLYEPYNGRSIPISWQSEAGTVYGGKLDVLSGVLRVTYGTDLFKNLSWSYQSANTRFYSASLIGQIKAPTNNANVVNAISDSYKVNSFSAYADKQFSVSTSGGLFLKDSSYTDVASFVGAMGDYRICYELATPIEIQLTPQQVNSLLGVNNIFADTGDTEVEYRANTKLYIERLTAPDSADMIADSNIVSGQYFMVGNSLYKATANIANGGQIIVGTNATRVSLAQALNEINA